MGAAQRNVMQYNKMSPEGSLPLGCRGAIRGTKSLSNMVAKRPTARIRSRTETRLLRLLRVRVNQTMNAYSYQLYKRTTQRTPIPDRKRIRRFVRRRTSLESAFLSVNLNAKVSMKHFVPNISSQI